ncbi:DUF6112 family protein [Nocardioides palaemonis]|uniref:DUF6112 family protein n=1 Tax=Nocardioides palaemonis TaxID=2829810 RepID=UPI00201111F6|nr:DUF6112 family protein [Nocardioides palaemonis]
MTAPTSARATHPDFQAVGGSDQLGSIVGALLTYGLICGVLVTVISAATWAVASSAGHWQTAQKAKAGLAVAIVGATLTGSALGLTNWLLDVGAHL